MSLDRDDFGAACLLVVSVFVVLSTVVLVLGCQIGPLTPLGRLYPLGVLVAFVVMAVLVNLDDEKKAAPDDADEH